MISPADRSITISRVIDAPREKVWRAFTEPEHLIKWWGPNGFTNTFKEISVTKGGVWRFIMHGPDGVDYPNRIIFEEIDPMNRIAFIHDSDGADNQKFQSTVTFEEEENRKTKVTLSSIFETKEARDVAVKDIGAIEGGRQTLGKLADYVTSML
jgi:uncharacterized protein YndB with AHSA1/START domain